MDFLALKVVTPGCPINMDNWGGPHRTIGLGVQTEETVQNTIARHMRRTVS